MIEIQIPRSMHRDIEEFIQDDFIKREFGYTSVQNFIIEAIEGSMEAEKDVALMRA